MGLSPQPLALAALVLALSAPRLAAQVTSTRIMQCGSPSETDVKCSTGGRAVRVSLVRDLAIRSCARPQAWGFTADHIWTNKCKGEFMVTYGPAPAPPPVQPAPAPVPPADTARRGDTRRITCGSTTGTQRQCSTGGPAVDMRMVRELSQGRCRKGTTWGHTGTLIWAHSGCRAEFEVTYRREAERPVRPVVRVMSCGAKEDERVECEAGGKITAVRLIRERSRGRCKEGSNWGFSGSAVWTSGSCRGDFEVTYRSGARTRE